MLTELRVLDLGIVDEISLTLGPGMTAITGETGAGKTMLMEALGLLLGGRADAAIVRDGADETRVEGRFVAGDDEYVLARVVPRDGRSRAYINGRLATVAELGELGATLVELHGQHAHQALVSGPHQRGALDSFAGAPAAEALATLRGARAEVREIDAAFAAIGGDEHARAREVELLRFQIDEIVEAHVDDVDEDDTLETRERDLADAATRRTALAEGYRAVEDTALDAVGAAVAALAPYPSLQAHTDRLRALQAELADLATDLRSASETVIDDPEALETLRTRRQHLRQLRRKYGETLAEVLEFGAEAQRRFDELEHHDERARELTHARDLAVARIDAASAALSQVRHDAAGRLGDAVTAWLGDLAMPRACLTVMVEPSEPTDDGADTVTFLLAANEGEVARPLARAASGGELARTMLALRLVLSDAPPSLAFDEVDAGIGGEAGTAVGRLLARLAEDRQVLCVTHLAQVAAFADAQDVVEKLTAGGRTVATVQHVEGEDRLRELSRMLAGLEASTHGREHAAELLARASRPGRPA